MRLYEKHFIKIRRIHEKSWVLFFFRIFFILLYEEVIKLQTFIGVLLVIVGLLMIFGKNDKND